MLIDGLWSSKFVKIMVGQILNTGEWRLGSLSTPGAILPRSLGYVLLDIRYKGNFRIAISELELKCACNDML